MSHRILRQLRGSAIRITSLSGPQKVSSLPKRLLSDQLPSSTSAASAINVGPAIPTASQWIAEDTLKITRNTLMPLNETFIGPLTRKTDDRIPLPVVLVVGNHSSGKSTFINYIAQRKIQEAGVAPTDDGFTVIAPGEKDVDQDGPSLVGDPNMGFSSLRTYGPSLIHHLRLKVRTDMSLKDVILIDSPGMIDSPTDTMGHHHGMFGGKGRKDRGYDFQGVTRWFAERADVILLFFDPDKPGTTGETLSVLTNSLTGMDHKFLIVMNKVDMFERSADFARSYGALCWNLSKVIPRKDLPRIYTTYTPLDTPYTSPSEGAQSRAAQRSFQGGGPSKADLDVVRNEIMNEIKNAPFRRVDNMISAVFDQTRLLKMHLEILEDARSDFQKAAWKSQLLTFGVGAGGIGLGLGPLFLFGPELWSFSAIVCGSGLLGALGLSMYNGSQLEQRAKVLLEDHSLESFYRKRFAREIAERDESIHAIWQRVRPQVRAALETFGLAKVPKVPQSSIRELDSILSKKVPELRTAASSRIGKVGR